MKYRITADVIVEADSEEDVVSRLSSRLSTIARHLGNGRALAENDPFFGVTIIGDDDPGDPHDMTTDPIIEADKAKSGESN